MEALAGTVTLLVAEDEPNDLELIRRALKVVDFSGEPRWVKDGQELLDFLWDWLCLTAGDEAEPLVVLLDLNMPRTNGCEVLAALGKHPALHGIPVVALLSRWSDDEVRRACALGADVCIPKPRDFAGFVDALKVVDRGWMSRLVASKRRAARACR